MKLKSLLLGSVAAAGLTTGAFAADLGKAVTSLDVCDLLGISGLTISSDSNCLQISGSVKYEGNWGDYADGVAAFGPYNYGGGNHTINAPGNGAVAGTADNQDWYSKVEWWLQFSGTASSDFGPAKAVIKLYNKEEFTTKNEVQTGATNASAANIKEAYVSVGDTTTLVAGRRDTSTFNDGDDTSFNSFLALFHEGDAVDAGVNVLSGRLPLKGHVIQLYHSLGNGVTIQGGLENLDGANGIGAGTVAGAGAADGMAGTAVGTINYVGDGLTGHVSVAAGGILDGVVEDWKVHSGFTATMTNFSLRAAGAGGSSTVNAVTTNEWNGLLTGQASLDMFTLSASVEGGSKTVGAAPTTNQLGFGGQASAKVTDTVSINAGFRWFDPNTATANNEGWEAAIQVVAALTETLTATGTVGYIATGSAALNPSQGVGYGAMELAWNPGGQFTSSIKGEMNALGAYKATFKASKSFN